MGRKDGRGEHQQHEPPRQPGVGVAAENRPHRREACEEHHEVESRDPELRRQHLLPEHVQRRGEDGTEERVGARREILLPHQLPEIAKALRAVTRDAEVEARRQHNHADSDESPFDLRASGSGHSA